MRTKDFIFGVGTELESFARQVHLARHGDLGARAEVVRRVRREGYSKARVWIYLETLAIEKAIPLDDQGCGGGYDTPCGGCIDCLTAQGEYSGGWYYVDVE